MVSEISSNLLFWLRRDRGLSRHGVLQWETRRVVQDSIRLDIRYVLYDNSTFRFDESLSGTFGDVRRDI